MLAVAAFFYRSGSAPAGPKPRVTILVPAHDESALIERCVRSLLTQSYPADRYRVVVIADNCTDDTAAIAEAAGARVLVRDMPEARGKGHALRWAMDRLLAATDAPDAIAVVDADSRATAGFLEALVAPLQRGAAAVQGESLLSPDRSAAAEFRAGAFLLVNRVRPAGRAVLGRPCHLAGNGMLFSRELLLANPWEAFTSAEDLEYSLTLRLRGIGPAFAGGAILESPTAPNTQAAAEQQLRWEGGKVHLARTWVPRLVAAGVRERRVTLLDAAFDLAVPPLGLLAAAAALGTGAGAALTAANVVPLWALSPWLAADVSLPLYVLLGLKAAGAPASAYRALARAPFFVGAKLMRTGRILRFRGDTWVRTERADADSSSEPD